MFYRILAGLLLIALCSCSSVDRLNKHIYSIQKEHLDVTPFVKDLTPMYNKISKEKNFRAIVLSKFYKEIYKANDTVIVKEAFGKMQLGYNIGINILYRDTNYFFTKNYDTKHGRLIFRKDYIYNYKGSHTFDIQKQVKDSIRHELWNREPRQYGVDCHDADPVFITVLYPTGNIECMYVRCWFTPQQVNDRQNINK